MRAALRARVVRSYCAERSSARRRLGPMLAALVAALAIAPVAGARASSGNASASSDGCRDASVRPAQSVSHQALRASVLCLVNRRRAAHHLPPLREGRALDRSAQAWTNTMVLSGAFSHGSNFAARITEAGVDWSAAAENIATGFATPREVVDAWMASSGHCRNILAPTYRLVGTGVDARPVRGWGSGGATWTEDFALPAGQPAPSHNWGPADSCPYAR